MRTPKLAGTIERRVLVNYRADPAIVQQLLPAGFETDIVNGHAIVGVCLIELRVRPTGFPEFVGFRSFNGAHRYAVIDQRGEPAVYIPRRDTNSRLVALSGGRLFPGAHRRAAVTAGESADRISITLDGHDGDVRVAIDARHTDALPADSVFDGVDAASFFFERANVGYSDAHRQDCVDTVQLDALQLDATNWTVSALAVDYAESSCFDDNIVFPPGSINLDHALFMRDIHHTWRPLPSTTSAHHRPAPTRRTGH